MIFFHILWHFFYDFKRIVLRSSGRVSIMSFRFVLSLSTVCPSSGKLSVSTEDNLSLSLSIRSTTSTSALSWIQSIRFAEDMASMWRTLSFWLASRRRESYQQTKLGHLKNFRYSPVQSPLIPDVNWGPDVSNVLKNSSGLKCCRIGVFLNGETFLWRGIKDAKYRSKGIKKLCVNSIKNLLRRALCTSVGRLLSTPFKSFLRISRSFWRKGLYFV